MKALNSHTAPKALMPERVIQFGEGNFLRAFVEWIIHEMNGLSSFNGSIVIVQPRERNHLETLRAQDCLYHINLVGLKEGREINECKRIGCISRALNPYTQFDTFMDLAEQPEIRFVVSNTTEAGIAFDPECKLEDKPAASYPAKLTQLLYRRYKFFDGDPKKGFIVMPCELIFGNGHRLKECVDKYIELWHDSLGDDHQGFKQWVDNNNYFCSTLVDRIVTGKPKEGMESLWERIGYRDYMLVQGEVYHLWVIERAKNITAKQLADEFPATKAGLNVLITDDETPYHERKVTLLNGPHTVLAPVAYLSGIDIVRDACNDPLIGKFIHKVQFDELLPTLNLPTEELVEFANDVIERFRNPFIDHQLTSIMLNSLPKFQTRDLPGLKTYLHRKGELPKCIVLGLAAIITYYKGGKRADGTEIVPNDDPEIIKLLNDLWATGDYDKIARGVLAAKDLIWKEQGDLNDIPGLTALVAKDLRDIQEKGMRKTVEETL